MVLFTFYKLKFYSLSSTSDLQPSTAIATQLPGQLVSKLLRTIILWGLYSS